MEATVEPRTQRRLTLVACLGAAWVAVIGGRLVQLQVVERETHGRVAFKQQTVTSDMPAPRGTIFGGGQGGGPLALSVPVRRIVINPLRIPAQGEDFTASVLERMLGLNAAEVKARIVDARKTRRQYLVIHDDATAEQIARLERSGLDIFTFEDGFRREYPKAAFASHILGWVNFEGHGGGGAERSLEEELAGIPGRVLKLRNSRNRDYHGEVLNQEYPVPGTSVYLTIDEAIQYAAEKALREAVRKERVPSGTIVVLNPKTGDILAMASYPPYHPKDRVTDDYDMLLRTNLAVGAPFEPGSVIKAVTIAAALETTRLRPESVIDCGNGVIRFPGRVIRDHHQGYRALSMTDVLAKSSNVGAINVGLSVKQDPLHAYMRKFGFGERTGVELPAEAYGVVHPVSEWGTSSIASVAMGHEMMATPLQLAQAFAIIANNGVLVRPRMVQARQKGNGPKVLIPVSPGERRIKAETAIALRRMLEQVVLTGTGTTARMNGYTVSGKTGTAQMIDPRTKKYIRRYNSSFVGMAPVGDPAIVVSVTLNASYKFGGENAAPVFREVAAAALRTLGIRKDLPDQAPPPAVTSEVESEPEPAKLLSEKSAATPPEPEDPELVSGPRVPDFSGMTMRTVLEKSAAEGWVVDAVGRGIARGQEPLAGTAVPAARRIRIVFRQ